MTVKTARKYLRSKLQDLSDDEVSSLISQLEILTEIFIETFEKNGSKKQLGFIDTIGGKGENGN